MAGHQTFEVGQKFNNAEELKIACDKFQEENTCKLYTRDSRTLATARKRNINVARFAKAELKYYEIEKACQRGGRQFTSSSTGQRTSFTIRCDCPWRLHLRASEDGQHLVVKDFVNTHNHELIMPEFSKDTKIANIDRADKRMVSLGAGKQAPEEIDVNLTVDEVKMLLSTMSRLHTLVKKLYTRLYKQESSDYIISPELSGSEHNEEEYVKDVLGSLYNSYTYNFLSAESLMKKLRSLSMDLFRHTVIASGDDLADNLQPVCLGNGDTIKAFYDISNMLQESNISAGDSMEIPEENDTRTNVVVEERSDFMELLSAHSQNTVYEKENELVEPEVPSECDPRTSFEKHYDLMEVASINHETAEVDAHGDMEVPSQIGRTTKFAVGNDSKSPSQNGLNIVCKVECESTKSSQNSPNTVLEEQCDLIERFSRVEVPCDLEKSNSTLLEEQCDSIDGSSKIRTPVKVEVLDDLEVPLQNCTSTVFEEQSGLIEDSTRCSPAKEIEAQSDLVDVSSETESNVVCKESSHLIEASRNCPNTTIEELHVLIEHTTQNKAQSDLVVPSKNGPNTVYEKHDLMDVVSQNRTTTEVETQNALNVPSQKHASTGENCVKVYKQQYDSYKTRAQITLLEEQSGAEFISLESIENTTVGDFFLENLLQSQNYTEHQTNQGGTQTNKSKRKPLKRNLSKSRKPPGIPHKSSDERPLFYMVDIPAAQLSSVPTQSKTKPSTVISRQKSKKTTKAKSHVPRVTFVESNRSSAKSITDQIAKTKAIAKVVSTPSVSSVQLNTPIKVEYDADTNHLEDCSASDLPGTSFSVPFIPPSCRPSPPPSNTIADQKGYRMGDTETGNRPSKYFKPNDCTYDPDKVIKKEIENCE